MSRVKTHVLKKLLAFNIIGSICLPGLGIAESNHIAEETSIDLDPSYLDYGSKLNDYILDSGDILNIQFINAPELSGIFKIDEEGQIYLKRIKKAYVRGLTILDLTKLLEKRYEEFLLAPEIYIKINSYKPIKVSIRGEVINSGIFKLSPYVSIESSLESNRNNKDLDAFGNSIFENQSSGYLSTFSDRSTAYVATISKLILKAGGLTAHSDLTRLEIIREIPKGRGGGRKKAIIDFTPYMKNEDSSLDLRLFDGDSIYIPRLEKPSQSIIRESIIAGISPKFISVTIGGNIQNPGKVMLPFQGVMSDAINLTGPIQPLSGKVFLIRYTKEGDLLRENINYLSSAPAGSSRNPTLLSGDLIMIKEGFLGRSTAVIKKITEPILGIYATKRIISDN